MVRKVYNAKDHNGLDGITVLASSVLKLAMRSTKKYHNHKKNGFVQTVVVSFISTFQQYRPSYRRFSL